MLLLRTFDEPSSGSRTTEKRPRPRSFTSPISSEATWATRFDSRHASTKRSFIQTSSSSCCSPYTLRLAAGSRRIGSSRRIRVTSPANRDNSRPRSRSTFPACSASVTSRRRPPSVLDVPSLEVVLQLLFSSVEVPPRTGMLVGEIRERLEIPHSLRPDVFHLCRERLLPEGVLPDRAAREEPGGPAVARDLDEPPEHVEVGPGSQHDPGHLRRAAQALAVLAELVGVGRHLRVPDELRKTCERLSRATKVPWVVLSAGADFNVFRGLVEVACHGGASGFLAGRAIWKDAFREKTLAALAHQHARPWWDFYGGKEELQDHFEGWYVKY